VPFVTLTRTQLLCVRAHYNLLNTKLQERRGVGDSLGMGVPANQPDFIEIAGTAAATDHRSLRSKLHSKLHLPHLHSSKHSSDTDNAAVSEKERQQALDDLRADDATANDETATTATAPDEAAHAEAAESETPGSITPDKQGFRERLKHSLPHRKRSS
jgi:hypothetical protein